MSPIQWNAAYNILQTWVAGGTHLGKVTQASVSKPHDLPMPWYHTEQCPCVQRSLVGWLWGEDSAAPSDPQRTTVAMHLTRSYLSCGRRDSKAPCGWLSRAPWPLHPGPSGSDPRGHGSASGSALPSAVFEKQVSAQPGSLGSPDGSHSTKSTFP